MNEEVEEILPCKVRQELVSNGSEMKAFVETPLILLALWDNAEVCAGDRNLSMLEQKSYQVVE